MSLETPILTIAGQSWRGWTAVTVTRSIEALAAGFNLWLTDRPPWDSANAKARPIAAGEACRLHLPDGTLLIDGWIDAVSPHYDAERHTVMIRGRNKAGDLVDCSWPDGATEWRGLNALDLTRRLVAPFKLSARADVDTGAAFERFSVRAGETIAEAIERACRMRGLLATSEPSGSIVLTRARDGGAALALTGGPGGRLRSASAEIDYSDRHSDYVCLGQAAGDDDDDPSRALHARGAAADAGVSRFRPLVLLAEDNADTAACRTRAVWEAAVRAGRSLRVYVTVTGWRPSAGAGLWQPNTLVRLADRWLGVEETLLISGVTFSQDDEGTRAELALVPPAAFRPEPPKPPKGDDGWR